MDTKKRLKAYDVVIADLQNMLKDKDDLAANSSLPPFVFEFVVNVINEIKISIESAINDLCKLSFYKDLKISKTKKNDNKFWKPASGVARPQNRAGRMS